MYQFFVEHPTWGIPGFFSDLVCNANSLSQGVLTSSASTSTQACAAFSPSLLSIVSQDYFLLGLFRHMCPLFWSPRALFRCKLHLGPIHSHQAGCDSHVCPSRHPALLGTLPFSASTSTQACAAFSPSILSIVSQDYFLLGLFRHMCPFFWSPRALFRLWNLPAEGHSTRFVRTLYLGRFALQTKSKNPGITR